MPPSTQTETALYDENWHQWVDMKSYGPASRYLRALITDLLELVPDRQSVKTALDLGCGEGTNTLLLAQHLTRAKVTGADFSATAISCARRHAKPGRLEFTLDKNSDSLDSRYDLITCFEVLEHVRDWRALLARMANASEKYLLLSFPTGKMRPFEVNVGHLRNFKKGEVETFLAGAGYEPVRVFYAGFPFYSPLYRDLCNLTNMANNSVSRGKFGRKQKLISAVGYFFFRHLSTRLSKGDRFAGLFRRRQPEN
ncbi:MAG: class I SAM-dependent methyltransferase [Elusimicrobiaceae bacterium]|nr:class I SAM-dependent methyltransferase [Elusimicrobiaceae bacterium]